jgi:hypothetical protein
MASRIRFRSAGFAEILRGPGTRSLVSGAAHRIASRVPGAKARVFVGNYGGGRAIGSVRTSPETEEEAVAQREALEAALHGG